MSPHLMTVAEAADYLNLTERALRHRVMRRTVPFLRLGARTIRFSQHTLDVWMIESQRYDGRQHQRRPRRKTTYASGAGFATQSACEEAR